MSAAGDVITRRWLPGLRAAPAARMRLFCFPYSGGGASVFNGWGDGLIPSVEVCAVELPGRGRRMAEPAITRMPELVAAAAEALGPYLDKPFALFGHSMGALAIFELARHLRASGGPAPLQLFASGHVAPQVDDRDTPIHTLPDEQFLAKLRSLNGTPAEVLENAELREIVVPILRSDFAICDTYEYTPGEPLDCPITAYGGLGDTHVAREHVEAWREQTRADFTLRMFPGDHFFLHSARPFVLRALATELSRLVTGLGSRA